MDGEAERRDKNNNGLLKWAAMLGIGWLAYDEWKRHRHSDRTLYGYDAEDTVADYLSRCGAAIGMSPGSRGPIDVYAEWSPSKRWGVQVKASRDGDAKLPRPAERERLIRACRDWRARPVIALVDDGRTKYLDGRTGERIYPPGRRRA
jgi:hypothetical protein